MTDEKFSTGEDHQLGVEIAAAMRDHEQSAAVDGIIAAVTSGTDRSRRRGSIKAHRQGSAVWLAAAAVVLLAGVTGLVVAGTSHRATVPPVTPPSPPVATALTASVVQPGDRVVAEGLGGIVTAGEDAFELCSLFTGAATSQSPNPSDSGDRPGFGCEALGAIKIATVKPYRPFGFAADQHRSVRVTGTYNADGSITVDQVVTAPGGPRPEDSSMTTPCPTPDGGWRLRDGDVGALNTFLNQHTDEYLSRGTSPEDKDYNVITVGTVSTDLVATRTELETIYGAPVCVYRATHSKKQLEAATSTAESVLRSHQEDLYTGPTNSVDSSLPLAGDSDTSVGYTRIITPALAEQLAPLSEFITFVPFIRPLHDQPQSEPTSSDMTPTPTTAQISEGAPATGAVESVKGGFADPDEVATPMITDWSGGPVTQPTVSAAWLRTRDRLVVTTFGSGSCPRQIQQVRLIGPQEIDLTIIDTQNEPLVSATPGQSSDSGTYSYPRTCTRDISPHTMIVRPPAGTSPDKVLVIHCLGSPITLPARTGTTAAGTSTSAPPTSAAHTSTTPSSAPSASALPTFVLPTFVHQPGAMTPEARSIGILTRGSDGCLYLGVDGPVAIWPQGYSGAVERSGVVRVLDRGSEVVRTGQTVDAIGGSFDPVPDGCSSWAGTFRVYLATVTG
ncbi:hypothetical protein ABLG96_08330 [Nakamurella sp. A5-74]|uniref:PASTA domain-containing protein n=1 Tax=Nakamurella sp. A5-74 TaxID=3158264 RepID=A0AAU8DU91_9ACTN